MKNLDDLELNAYVDGELSTAERAEMLAAITQDSQLAREACALSNLKQQIQLAYAHPPKHKNQQQKSQKRPWLAIAASLVMLATGLLGGWLLNSPGSQVPGQRFVVLDPTGRGQAPAVAGSPETRIVFHLTNADQTLAGELLDDVEQILSSYQHEGKPLRVEIVSNGDGLSLLRARLSRHKQRINKLAGLYNNLTFVACKNTIQRLQVSEGIEINILPEAEVINSGVDHVVKRQREGWAYIRV
jgi:intracellular sulfur oxidation DsrE/DsrF family protein